METLYKLVCENGGYDKASAPLRSRSPSVVISLPSLHLPFRIVRCSAPDTQVCEQKRWIAISEKLGLTAYSSAPTVIKGHYQKLLHERRLPLLMHAHHQTQCVSGWHRPLLALGMRY